MLLFGDPWSADAFRAMDGLSTEWEVIGARPPEALEPLQTGAAKGIRYAETEPRVVASERKTRRGRSPLGGFVDRLWGAYSRMDGPIPKTVGASSGASNRDNWEDA